ncbi:iron complex outermembrane receptor protein [Sphingomonas sp. UYAg733]
MTNIRKTLATSTALSLLALSMPAFAQDAATLSDEDIIVTAQKREQTVIDVPQSITVVSGAALAEQHAATFGDYLKLIPGLQLTQSTPGESRLVIRGLNTGGVASTVAVYEDETPFGSSSGLANGAILAGDFDTFDVARIEVLRGPQGTLYGASSLGGVLKFVTNAPDTEHFLVRSRAGVETTRGGDTSYYGNLVVNVPLSSTLAFRASGSYRNDGGFIDSIGTGGSRVRDNINGSRNFGGRASLLFKPTDTMSFRLNALVQNIETDAPTTVESNPATLKTLYGRPTQSIFVAPFKNIDYRIYNGVADFDLGFATLTSSSSYSTQHKTQRTDITNSLSGTFGFIFQVPGVGATPTAFLPNEALLAQNTNVDKFTQEVRLASSSSPVLDWVLGGYYTHEKGLIRQQYILVAPGTLTPITTLPAGTINALAGPTVITTLPLLALVGLNSKYEEIAGFANATVHLGDMFDIDLGGRYSHNSQIGRQTTDGLPALTGGTSDLSQNSSDNVFTYSVAPKLKFGKDLAIYARVAKGFRPGGPNALAPGAPDSVRTYQSDSVISYEAGVKFQTPDRTFSIDLSAYHIDWSRIQLIAAIGSFNVNTNGRGAKSDGVEFTASMRPIKGFEVSLNGAYTNARLTSDTTVITNGVPGPNLVGGRAGDKLPYTPKISVSANGDYHWAVGDQATAYLGGSLRFLSKQNAAFDNAFRTANGRQRQIASYEVIDLRAGVTLDRFSIEAYVKNLGDSDGKQSTGALGNYPAGAIDTGVIRPRTIGASLGVSF